jgi:putative transposase
MGRIISFYNERRPHMSDDMLTPSQAYETDGELKRRWKKKFISKRKNLCLINP